MIKKTINYLLFSVFAAGIGFLTTIYMARTISQEEMGIIGLFMAILFITPQLISFASTGLVPINKVKLTNEKFIDFSRTYITFGFLNFIIIFIVSCISGIFFKDYLEIFLILPIISFLMFLISFHHTELIQEGKSKKYGVYNLFNAGLVSLLTIISISILNFSWDGRLWAMLITQCFILFLMYKNTFKTILLFKIKFDKSSFKEFIKFGLPLFAGLGAGWILNQADNYIVLHFFSLKDVGVYAVAYSIGTIVNMINQAATNAIVPTLYNALEKKEGHKIIKKLNLYYSMFIITISLIIGGGSFWYMPLVFGEAYAQSADIVFFISLAFGFNGIYRATGSVIAFYKKNNLQMKIIYGSAIVNMVVSMLLIPYFGLVSPAIGTLVAYVVLAYLSYHFGWKILRKEELNYEKNIN